MAFRAPTDAELAYLRSELGDAPPDEELLAAFERHEGAVAQVVLEVLRGRLSRLVASPASFSLPGVYSQDQGANIKALQDQLTRVAVEAGAVEGDVLALLQRARITTRRRR